MFVRSPHAHAKIKRVDVTAAAAMPGVVGVLTGADLAGDKIGNLICSRLDGPRPRMAAPMKMAPHPALAERQGQLCR